MANQAGPLTSNPNDGQRRSSEPLRPGLLDRLAGESESFVGNLKPFLPLDLIGGAVPAVAGMEDEAVWNAASQACGTEKVHYTFTVSDGRCWYLACPSSALASAPDSWCPLAAALPGNSEFWDRETVYIYESEGLAAALRWDRETSRMQVFTGAARTLLPRIQSMDANFVAINPVVAQIVPWRNRAMRTEKLSRAAARMLLLSGLVTNFVFVALLFVLYLSTSLVDRNLADVRAETESASSDLMDNAYKALQSDTTQHFVKVQQLLQDLQQIDGTLVRYEVKDGGDLEWEALVPAAYSSGIASVRGQVQQGIEKDGRVRIKGK
jgi:hypothetical protein